MYEAILPALERWRRAGVLLDEPEKVAALKYRVRLTNGKTPEVLGPLTDLILVGAVIESCDKNVSFASKKTDVLYSLAQALVRERPQFFDIKGPGAGDHETAAFVRELRARAIQAFKTDYSQKQICGDNDLCVDFYFAEEHSIVEVALRLRNPLSEYERDILKAIMAKEAGNEVSHLYFISKPGALKRLAQPSARCIASWVEEKHGIKVHVREL